MPQQESNPEIPAMREHNFHTSYDHNAALTTTQRHNIQVSFARLRANSIRSSGEHRPVMRAAPARAGGKPVSAQHHHPFNRILPGIHEWPGLTELALIAARLAWRAYAGIGRLHATMSPRTRIAAAVGRRPPRR